MTPDLDEYMRRAQLAREAELCGTSETLGVMVPWRDLAELVRLARFGRARALLTLVGPREERIAALQHEVTSLRSPFLKKEPP